VPQTRAMMTGSTICHPASSTGLTQKIANGVTRYLQGKTDKDIRVGPIVRTHKNLRTRLKRVV